MGRRNTSGLGSNVRMMRPLVSAPLIEVQVDYDCLARIDAIAAEARREMGEARWAELNAEWL